MYVEKSTLAGGTLYAVPYYVVSGLQSGPVFMIVSGIHGNERASIRAAKNLAELFIRGEMMLLRGRLVIVPLVNKKAYRKKSRGKPDLNRTFPHAGSVRASHPLSAALYRLAKQHSPSWYLDLHEANGLSARNPRRVGQTLIISKGSRASSTARQIVKRMNQSISNPSYHFNIRRRERTGTSRMAAERMLGAKAVTVETCWSLDFQLRVRYQSEIVHHFLRAAGLIG
ncbi:deacylase [Paenibacillus sp. PK3_47]|uniref:succinylglutamate desuccinylase/aspartoacylase domain-containing protein n=1 Tax=Paenibacillus sp. PK3_47 TaxID=2072642 RepID=UPI00201E26DB|nr:succinylglutamate desuccinylase/aspartoacylase family protein [Paenibacillus sp. PK3_47]UQZ37019.1 deacylase [Paenibacillus sp. PK3_47]